MLHALRCLPNISTVVIHLAYIAMSIVFGLSRNNERAEYSPSKRLTNQPSEWNMIRPLEVKQNANAFITAEIRSLIDNPTCLTSAPTGQI
jgi:predicted metalloprotease with PDZ domain